MPRTYKVYKNTIHKTNTSFIWKIHWFVLVNLYKRFHWMTEALVVHIVSPHIVLWNITIPGRYAGSYEVTTFNIYKIYGTTPKCQHHYRTILGRFSSYFFFPEWPGPTHTIPVISFFFVNLQSLSVHCRDQLHRNNTGYYLQTLL